MDVFSRYGMTPPSPYRRDFSDIGVMAVGGLRLLADGLLRKFYGPQSYEGSAEEICEQIVGACFDEMKGYYRTSASSYPEFWARDFGRCVPALLELGFEDEVTLTYRYALKCYEREAHYGLVITPEGQLYDFPTYAPDGYALFLHGLRALNNRSLIAAHRALLEREARRFVELVIDKRKGLIRRGASLSEAQDYAVRDSSCYSNSICYLLQQSLDALGLANPLAEYDYEVLIMVNFWDEDHFFDDLTRPPYPSGDAQIMPFWVGLFDHASGARQRLESVLKWMEQEKLNDPIPTRYGNTSHEMRRMHILDWVNPWQRDSSWTCLGLQYLEVLRRVSHPKYPAELERYRSLVERLKCFPEVIDGGTGAMYSGTFYTSEDSMLWAATLWQLLKDKGALRSSLPEPPLAQAV
jgi:hypothetical protein